MHSLVIILSCANHSILQQPAMNGPSMSWADLAIFVDLGSTIPRYSKASASALSYAPRAEHRNLLPQKLQCTTSLICSHQSFAQSKLCRLPSMACNWSGWFAVPGFRTAPCFFCPCLVEFVLAAGLLGYN